MRRATSFTLALFFNASAACSPAAAPPQQAITAPKPSSSAAPGRAAEPPPLCPSPLDVGDLLVRHAHAFGEEGALLESLPRTMSGTLAVEGKEGAFEIVLDRARHRSASSVMGLFSASGVDDHGAWSLGLTGIVSRPAADEAIDIQLDAWILRRAYIGAFKAGRDEGACEADDKGAHVTLRYKMPELGDPILVFDAKSAALLAAKHTNGLGRALVTTYDGWSRADEHGVRWPSEITDRPPVGSVQVARVRGSEAGAACSPRAPRWPAATDCFAPPTSPLVFAWPDAPVHVPMTFYQSELAVRVKVGGRETWALLDSGAGLTAIDITTTAGAAFKPVFETEGMGATAKVQMGLGEIDALSIGALSLSHVPVVGVPIPALAAFGDHRPDIILGYSLFEGSGVRVDYARSEVVFARDPAGLHGRKATSIPVRVYDAEVIADVTVDGVTAPMQLDTGNSGGFDMYQFWAEAHSFPGSRRSTQLKSRFGAGTSETTSTFFRIAAASLGPMHHDDRVAKILTSPLPGAIAGIVGNEVFAHCAALVFDIPHHAVWVEPPCDRKVPEQRAGWRLENGGGERPWVVGAIVDDSAAARAGLRSGDRLLEIGGKPALLDRTRFDALTEQPVGTKVPVVVEREGAKVHAVMTLTKLLGN